MGKIILVLMLLFISQSYCQFELKFDTNLLSIKDEEHMILHMSFTNNQPYDQVLFLQNWRLATESDAKIVGFPYMTNLLNKLYLVKKGQDFYRIFLGEDQSYGDFINNNFKLLKTEESFDIYVVISDSNFIKLIFSENYTLYYFYCYARYVELETIINTNSKLNDAFIDKNSIIMIFNKSDYNNELTNYNIKNNISNKIKLDLETIFKINDKFQKKLFTFP